MITINLLEPKKSFNTKMPLTYMCALYLYQAKQISDMVIEMNGIFKLTIRNQSRSISPFN